jgi:REP element-mobilizing transposase RayT
VPQTFTQLHYHLVFSTKYREPTLVPKIRGRVWEYLGGIVRGEGGIPLCIGGTADHVHLLVTLKQHLGLAEFMKRLKGNSSTWMHEAIPGCGVWRQAGYGAFTVSHSATLPVGLNPSSLRDSANGA